MPSISEEALLIWIRSFFNKVLEPMN
jgi:hypothetical protein